MAGTPEGSAPAGAHFAYLPGQDGAGRAVRQRGAPEVGVVPSLQWWMLIGGAGGETSFLVARSQPPRQTRSRFALSRGRPGGLLGSRLLRCAGRPGRRWCRAAAPFALGGVFSATAGIAAGPQELVAARPGGRAAMRTAPCAGRPGSRFLLGDGLECWRRPPEPPGTNEWLRTAASPSPPPPAGVSWPRGRLPVAGLNLQRLVWKLTRSGGSA
ncbi:hypothetical protein NDU88_005115 [Pleurodeles waltl]|uniref:Uncharacterized protein n=1 Tax=Pleurodeles waltl TaxID=8319 RepID=A0AAV7LK62_PLEWA|nr:hypothetical protein NDU88_005115 [Pleurodeles waltl]